MAAPGFEHIIDHIISNDEIIFKSQQRNETDLSPEEKRKIATEILNSNKSTFLSRFGKFLNEEHLEIFEKYTDDPNEGYDLKFYILSLKRYFSTKKRNMDIRNRRYSALNKLIEENSYFTETEMMRRNPLLYNQLVGQYMSEEEKKKRDNIDTQNITFVNLLLETIDRDQTKEKQKKQEEIEDDQLEEEDSDEETKKSPKQDMEIDEEIPTTSKWGEFPGSEPIRTFNNYQPKKEKIVFITASERKLLKEEFTSIMYQNFIDGKDDFDYSTIDNNEEYDNIDIKNIDAEEKYFDSESPEECEKMTVEKEESSEDELDIFMKRLNQHHSIKELSQDLSNL